MSANPHRLVLDRAVQSFLESIDGRETATDRAVRVHDGFVGLAVDVQEIVVDAGVFEPVPVYIVRPAGIAATLPVVLYLHGGGATVPGIYSHARLVAELVHGAAAAVVVPQHGVAPGVQHPTVLEQAYATARWINSQGSGWRLDHTRMAVAGDSSGANVAIGTVLLSLRRNEFRFSQLVAFTPITDTVCDAESCNRFDEGYFLRGADLRALRYRYLPDRPNHGDPTVAPLRADRAELAGFPGSLVITAEADIVRDQGEAFAARLREAGAATTAVRYEGTVHGFVALEALRATSASRAALAQAASALGRSLHGNPPVAR